MVWMERDKTVEAQNATLAATPVHGVLPPLSRLLNVTYTVVVLEYGAFVLAVARWKEWTVWRK